MTWNLTQTMSLIKAAQHKYTHRKLIGRDPKTNRARYRYYYARHHGGGITGAKFEAGSAFKLTFKGRRGHFHVDRVEGDKVFVKHDGRPGSKEVEMSRDELRALLEKQHSKAETKSREKAQENRRKGRKSTAKKRKSTKRKKAQTTAPKKAAPKKAAPQTPREQLIETTQPAQEAPETKQPVSDLSPVERMHKKGSPRAIGTRDLARKMDAVEQAIKGIEFTFKGKSFGLDSWQSRRHEDYGGGKIIKVKKNHKYLSGKVARRRIEVNAGELQDAMDFTRRGTGMARGVSVSTLSFNEANQFNEELKSTINAALERAMPGITDDRAGNFGFDYDGNYTADIRAGMVAAYIPQTAEQAKLAEDFSQLETLEAVKSLKNDEIEDEKTAYANTAAAAGHLRKELNEYPEYPKDPSTTYTERAEWKEGKKALEQRYILARDLSNRFFTLAQKRGTIQ